jgi:hypothetical protein
VSTTILRILLPLVAACASSEKPFDQMTAQEHHDAADRENRRADDALSKVHPDDIVGGEVYYGTEQSGSVPYYQPYELGDPETYIAWPRVSDPSEKYEDSATKHRERALRHERAAAALEGHPSPQPLPPPQEPLLPPDHG